MVVWHGSHVVVVVVSGVVRSGWAEYNVGAADVSRSVSEAGLHHVTRYGLVMPGD
jgi:hypothetical protein